MGIAQNIFWICTGIFGFFYTSYYAFCMFVVSKKDYRVEKDKNNRPTVSIIIPTWNEVSTIEGKIKDTLNLDYPKNRSKIIIIDSGSDDGTTDIAERFSNRYEKVQLIKEEVRRGKASALNQAVVQAKGEVVVMTDSDCRLKKDALIQSMPYFNDSSVGAVTGRESIIIPEEKISTKTESTYRGLFYLLREAESKLDSTYIHDGPFFAFRRTLFKKLPENTVADDSELGLMIKKAGYRVLSIPEATYYEYAPSKMSEWTKQKSRRAEGITQTMMNHFTTFFMNPSYGIFGLLIFPAGFFMHVLTPFIMILATVTFFTLPLIWMLRLAVAAGVGLIIPQINSFAFTFVYSQYASLLGILRHFTMSPDFKWDKIEDTRRY
jgi:cellulose synthase/poly-beta-1,6-N-acetylglucosamine synthase-like glycosyltransferase